VTAAEDPRARRRRGIALALLANLCFSTGGLWIRALDVPPGGFEIVFWRSASMTAALAVFLFAWHGRATAARIRAVGFWGFVSACCLAATFFAFILSVTRTTVANTTLVMSLTPLLGAVAGVVFLGERVAVRTWIAIAVAGVGLATMLLDSLSGDGVAGILIALGVPVAFAANIVINRRHGVATDMVPTVLIAGLVSLPLALPLALPLEANPRDAATILAMGMFQLPAGKSHRWPAAPPLNAPVDAGGCAAPWRCSSACWPWSSSVGRPPPGYGRSVPCHRAPPPRGSRGCRRPHG